jgi:hypothetical protein
VECLKTGPTAGQSGRWLPQGRRAPQQIGLGNFAMSEIGTKPSGRHVHRHGPAIYARDGNGRTALSAWSSTKVRSSVFLSENEEHPQQIRPVLRRLWFQTHRCCTCLLARSGRPGMSAPCPLMRGETDLICSNRVLTRTFPVGICRVVRLRARCQAETRATCSLVDAKREEDHLFGEAIARIMAV